MKKCVIILLLFCAYTNLFSQNWDHIRLSGDYYFGEGTAATEEEAGNTALEDLLQQIAVHVSSEYNEDYRHVNTNGEINSKETVSKMIRTYAYSSLTNVQTWKVSSTPNAVVRKYMLKSELAKMYEARVSSVQDMVRSAERSLQTGNVAVALQYYYWAYMLAQSLPSTFELKDEEGLAYVNELPRLIQQIIQDIKVEYADRDGDYVDLLFTYQGKPVTVDFFYNDGRSDGCNGYADGGNASIEMAAGYAESGIYKIRIEYEYENQARGNAEMQSVMAVVPRTPFGKEKIVKVNQTGVAKSKPKPTVVTEPDKPLAQNQSRPSETRDDAACVAPMNQVLEALQTRRYEKAQQCFTGRGLDNYNKLITRRTGRVVGSPKITFYPGPNGTTIARGLQMAFSVVERGQKHTLVDDVIFTFDQNHQICNLTLGIGSIAENDLLNKNVKWGEETRQQLLSFLENYKTAYCLKDTAFINAIFDENATIIVGHVAKRTNALGYEEGSISMQGQEIITYNHYTKDTYLAHLKNVFKRNQFINIKFTNNDVMWLENEPGKVFSIKIGQEYSSSSYADIGQLFLMVDMTDPDSALIKIRTWQPVKDPELGWYGAGHFHK